MATNGGIFPTVMLFSLATVQICFIVNDPFSSETAERGTERLFRYMWWKLTKAQLASSSSSMIQEAAPKHDGKLHATHESRQQQQHQQREDNRQLDVNLPSRPKAPVGSRWDNILPAA